MRRIDCKGPASEAIGEGMSLGAGCAVEGYSSELSTESMTKSHVWLKVDSSGDVENACLDSLMFLSV